MGFKRKQAAFDLLIVVLFIGLPMAIFGMMGWDLGAIKKISNVYTRIGAITLVQFASEGVAPILLLRYRGESLKDYGVTTRRLVPSILLGIGFALLDMVVEFARSGRWLWIPLKRIWATEWSLTLPFPMSVLGVALVAVVWGFLEGFILIYASKKINVITGTTGRHPLLLPGPYVVAVLNLLIHIGVGQNLAVVAWGLLGSYMITIIPELTENAWGGMLLQTLRNAVG
ncbi:MAG: hypothetical protein ACM3ZQ_04790 [Bacillota bacterium]